MATKHVELIAKVHPGVDPGPLRERLRQKGIETLAMKVGFLLSGDVSTLRTVLPDLSGDEQFDVGVPEGLRDTVKSIQLVKPRTLY